MFAVQIKIEVIDTETGEAVNSRGLTQGQAIRMAGPSKQGPVGGFPMVTCTRVGEEYAEADAAREHLNAVFAVVKAISEL